jgi:hypothetical protein
MKERKLSCRLSKYFNSILLYFPRHAVLNQNHSNVPWKFLFLKNTCTSEILHSMIYEIALWKVTISKDVCEIILIYKDGKFDHYFIMQSSD